VKIPDDLPCIIEYRCGCTVRLALPRMPVEAQGSSGKTNQANVCPQIPVGADAWRKVTEAAWRPLHTIPRHWMPFLDRARPGPMDQRKPVQEWKKVKYDAIQDGE
jgi:hypothetical protein